MRPGPVYRRAVFKKSEWEIMNADSPGLAIMPGMTNPSPLMNSTFPAAAVLAGAAFLLAAPWVPAANIVSAADGNWSNTASWTPASVPGSGGVTDNVFIRNMNTIAITSNVTPTPPGAVSDVIIGDSSTSTGTLNIQAGGALTTTGVFRVMRAANGLNGAVGVLDISGGGSLTRTGTGAFSIGQGTGTQTGNGSGTLNISGPSTLSIGGSTTIGSSTAALGSGFLNISDSTATINGTNITLNPFGAISFTFDNVGISSINLSGTMTFSGSGSTLSINGSSYAGGGGSIILINANTLTNTATNVSITGFNAAYGTPSLTYDTGNGNLILNLAAVPEPQSYLLLGIGGMALAWWFRTRRRPVRVS